MPKSPNSPLPCRAYCTEPEAQLHADRPVLRRGDWPCHPRRAQAQPGYPADRTPARLLAGVGTGLDLPHLPPQHHYVGLDLNRAMLRRALPRVGPIDFNAVQGDAQRLPFADASFDSAVLHLILAVVPSQRTALPRSPVFCGRAATVLVFDKFLRRGQPALLRRLANPLVRRVATRLDVVFEDLLAEAPDLVLEHDQPALAGGWFRMIRLQGAETGGAASSTLTMTSVGQFVLAQFILDPGQQQRISDRQHHRANKIPIRPKPSMPPMTPAKISSNGRSAPFLISIGRRKLSSVVTKMLHTSRPSPSHYRRSSTSSRPPEKEPGRGRSGRCKTSA
jgi:phosphatidylethanolamine/phosphatidyl-N-methylethanolamine N-methyltransferase